jgi:hypothetical protein
VDDRYFVKPEERTMKFEQFLDISENKDKHNGIFYVQHQVSPLIKTAL